MTSLTPGPRYAWCPECEARIQGPGELRHHKDCPNLTRSHTISAPTGKIVAIDAKAGTVTIADATGHDSGEILNSYGEPMSEDELRKWWKGEDL